MSKGFAEVKLFQVRPDRVAEFEALIGEIVEEQGKQPGCLGISYMRRSHVIDEIGLPPRELTRIVKCVKYYSYWRFDTIEAFGEAEAWFFRGYMKRIMRCLIMPFDINSGYEM